MPPNIQDTQPCPYCGYVEGMDHMDPLDGEPAGKSKVRIWAKSIAIAMIVLFVVAMLYIAWGLYVDTETVVQGVPL